MRILTVVGARPQFIKAAALSRCLRDPEFAGIQEKIVHTGQHYDYNLSAAFFEELDIPEPSFNLGAGSGTHAEQTGTILLRLEEVVKHERADLMLLYGDTNSTVAGALVGAKVPIPMAHIEAGLRSYRRGMPEEVNRVVTDRLSDLLFAPTSAAVEQLRREGRTQGVYRVGDVMYDSFLYVRDQIDRTMMQRGLSLKGESYILLTVHREDNTENPDNLAAIMEGMARISKRIPVVFPAHPRTAKALRHRGVKTSEGLRVIEPVSYLKMLGLLTGAAALATDSGGLQKEAYFAGVPCVTLRDETEWVETLEKGWNRLASPEKAGDEGIEEAVLAALSLPRDTARPAHYGHGDAAKKILRILRGHV